MKCYLFFIALCSAMISLARAAEPYTHTSPLLQPERLMTAPAYQLAKTWFLPDYQGFAGKRSGETSQNDNKPTCQSYGFLDTVPPHMTCKTVAAANLSCYQSCVCQSGYKSTGNIEDGCAADCASMGYSLKADLTCATGQSISSCAADSSYGKCEGSACPEGIIACDNQQYCVSWQENSRPGVCPDLCSRCATCPADLGCGTCSAYEEHEGCERACVKCCPEPLACGKCKSFSAEPNCGSVCTECCPNHLQCDTKCKTYSSDPNCSGVCIECESPVCEVPPGDGWKNTASISGTETSQAFLAELQIYESKETFGPNACGDSYQRNCLRPFENKGWNLLADDPVTVTPLAPTWSGNDFEIVLRDPVEKASQKIKRYMLFASCGKRYDRTCYQHAAPSWKEGTPPTTNVPVMNTNYPVNYSSEEEEDCNGKNYYRTCGEPNQYLGLTKFVLVAEDDPNAEDFGPQKPWLTNIPTYWTYFTLVPESKMGLRSATVKEIFSSCGKRWERDCKAYIYADNKEVPWKHTNINEAFTTTVPAQSTGTTSLPITPTNEGIELLSETYYDDCGYQYFAQCYVPASGSGYVPYECTSPGADWTTSRPSMCGPGLHSVGVVETKVNCSDIYYKCNTSGSSGSPSKIASEDSCFYDEGRVYVESFSSCGKQYDRKCIYFEPYYGWYQTNSTPPSGTFDYIRDDGCGRIFACGNGYRNDGSSTTPTNPSGTSTTPTDPSGTW